MNRQLRQMCVCVQGTNLRLQQGLLRLGVPAKVAEEMSANVKDEKAKQVLGVMKARGLGVEAALEIAEILGTAELV